MTLLIIVILLAIFTFIYLICTGKSEEESRSLEEWLPPYQKADPNAKFVPPAYYSGQDKDPDFLCKTWKEKQNKNTTWI